MIADGIQRIEGPEEAGPSDDEITERWCDECGEPAPKDGPCPECAFNEWIRQLDEDVIQGEYGYEQGEFTVYAEMWRPLYVEGLTPQQAFKRALDAYAESQ